MLLNVFKIVISDIYLKMFSLNKKNMDTDEALEKMSLSEIRELFQNLKYVGMSDEEIEKQAVAYKTMFERRVKAKAMVGSIVGSGATGPTFQDNIFKSK